MTNLTQSNIEQLIHGYLSVYLNPRTTNKVFGNQAVFFQKYANDLKHPHVNDKFDIDWHLSFDVFGRFDVSEVIHLFFKELNTIYNCRNNNIDEIIVAFY